MIQCNLECAFGYARGQDGCPLCECADPCDVSYNMILSSI